MLGQQERRREAARRQLLHDGAHFQVAEAKATFGNRGEHPVHPSLGESVQVLGGNVPRRIDRFRVGEQQGAQPGQTFCQLLAGHGHSSVPGRVRS